MLQKFLASALLVFVTTAHADEGNDWKLRIKKEGDGWTVNLNGPREYGSNAKRLRGSGHVVEKARQVGAFTKLRLEGPVDVRLNQAAADAVKVSADDNIEPLVETRVDGDTLVLRLQAGAGFTTRQAPIVFVDAKALQSIVVNGSGDLSLERFKGDQLGLTLSGSGDLRVGLLEVRELNATLSGSGDVRVAGRADVQSWTLNGSGDVDARSLGGRSAKALLNGSGDLDLGTLESLDASLRGSGDLSYGGRPRVKQSISGSGEIHRR